MIKYKIIVLLDAIFDIIGVICDSFKQVFYHAFLFVMGGFS
jgi:hypothetical protein